MYPVDQLSLNFDQGDLKILNIILGIIMFGIALDIKIQDFKNVFKKGIGPIIGLICQFLLLPAFTFLLTLIINPAPSIALGMILVAACPGGNMSNFFSYLSKANTALSISMTAISTAFAVIATPFNIYFWGSLSSNTSIILREVSLNPIDLFKTIFIILGIPLLLGMFVSYKLSKIAKKVKKPLKYFGILSFIVFLIIAFTSNFDNFIKYIGYIAIIVFLHNTVALATGYFFARLFRLSRQDARTISLEVGIQNVALGLIIIFTFFDGLGGMALVAAWWGIWLNIAGLSLSLYWSKRPVVIE